MERVTWKLTLPYVKIDSQWEICCLAHPMHPTKFLGCNSWTLPFPIPAGGQGPAGLQSARSRAGPAGQSSGFWPLDLQRTLGCLGKPRGSVQATSRETRASDASSSGPSRRPWIQSRACTSAWVGKLSIPHPPGREGGHQLTAGVEHPRPLGVSAGSVEDEFVVVKQGIGALCPQNHHRHVF